jgi:outer membrane lipoprotein-sorting protein
MRSADKIKRYFKNARLIINPDADEKVFKDVIRARQEIAENVPAVSESLWRIMTKSPLAALAVVAVLIIAGVTGLFLWKSTGSGIALADVLTRIEQAKAYMYEMSMTVTGRYFDGNPIHLEAQFTVLASREYGERINCETSPLPITGQRINQEMYILPSQKTITTLMPDDKTYSQIEFDETSLERMSREYNDPRFIVRQILACKHTSLGKSVIDGVEVERFQTTDPNFFGSAFGQAETKVEIWVDVTTRLPMRLELEADKDDTMRIHALACDFQWDVSVDAAEFEPVIPDDYTIGQPPMIIGP